MTEISNLENTLTTGELIAKIKKRQGIMVRNNEIMDCYIGLVCCLAGLSASDTTLIEGHPIMGEIGLGIMKLVTIMEFPDYYLFWYDQIQRN